MEEISPVRVPEGCAAPFRDHCHPAWHHLCACAHGLNRDRIHSLTGFPCSLYAAWHRFVFTAGRTQQTTFHLTLDVVTRCGGRSYFLSLEPASQDLSEAGEELEYKLNPECSGNGGEFQASVPLQTRHLCVSRTFRSERTRWGVTLLQGQRGPANFRSVS